MIRSLSLGKFIAVHLLVFVCGCAQEPRYQSRTATVWLEELKDPNPGKRFRAAFALGEMEPKAQGALEALIEALNDPHTTVRFESIKALTKFGAAANSALPALRDRLNDPEESVKDAAKIAVQYLEQTPAKAR